MFLFDIIFYTQRRFIQRNRQISKHYTTSHFNTPLFKNMYKHDIQKSIYYHVEKANCFLISPKSVFILKFTIQKNLLVIIFRSEGSLKLTLTLTPSHCFLNNFKINKD